MKIDVNQYNRIDNLIRLKSTGPPEHLANQLGISKRQILKILKHMKEHFHAPIKYNSFRQTYFYTEEGFFVFGFQKCKKEDMVQAVSMR
jgi:hypothetical protein